MGGGYRLSKGRRMQVVQSDYFEMLGKEDIRKIVVRDKFGTQSCKTCTFQSLAYLSLRPPLREGNMPVYHIP